VWKTCLPPFDLIFADEFETGDTDGEKMALTGCLSQDSNGIFSLVESESGDSITVEGPDDLGIETHVGHLVKVTGQ